MTDKYIVLTDTIIAVEKIVMVYREPGKVTITFDSTVAVFDGEDARIIWESFDPSRDWALS